MEELNQKHIDADWESLKKSFEAKGFTEIEFLKAQIGLHIFGGDLPTEIKNQKLRAFKEFDGERYTD